MKKLKRREFLKKGSTATLLGGSALLLGCQSTEETNQAPAVHTRKTYQWKMVTTWPPHFPVMGEGADLMAEWIDEMSEGRLKIQVYGGGELVPPLEVFDAVSGGVAEMGHGVGYYWAGKVPAAQFFAAVPFGMNAQQMNAWLYSGGGVQLWEDVYAPFNLVPIPAGNTGVQMGGWFNREINTTEDLKGLKMRIPGLGAKVIAKAGGSPILTAGGEIYTNLDRGVIDATEWVGPYHDYLMEFHKIAKYYYYPGWHETGPVLELTINKAQWERLPKDLQAIVRTAAARANVWMLSEFEAKNHTYLQKIMAEDDVEVRKFPDEILTALKGYAQEVIEEVTAKDPQSKKVYESFDKFRRNVTRWAEISEKVYYSLMEV
ncbi:TRAP transporter substrate-binding protein [candidate division KSB1 bacterium]|nr:TRAP transporter substrate-binding protein [candidate division KSB1 bacterium]NIR70286.1 TRAP transporter substrate-binding protein [candidate division KSB1 bacterium]NIS26556.1 TRAP transporter substrate-binding protein [candidate division KSB1 bacterium]NIT73319.1 TRAP transporter substrate-binding protein [candidate division KSB1 bacterium]NIU23942.1 TRAP transporter substrate-binding protein [candidate division KSB1 bacterium]